MPQPATQSPYHSCHDELTPYRVGSACRDGKELPLPVDRPSTTTTGTDAAVAVSEALAHTESVGNVDDLPSPVPRGGLTSPMLRQEWFAPFAWDASLRPWRPSHSSKASTSKRRASESAMRAKM